MWHDREHLVAYSSALVVLAACGLWHYRSVQGDTVEAATIADRRGAEAALEAARAARVAMTGRSPEGLLQVRSQEVGKGASRRVIWRVEEVDGAGRVSGTLVQDAVSGEVVYVAMSPALCVGGRPVRTPGAAAKRAWAWMECLGISAQCPEWRLRSEPRLCLGNWQTRWAGSDRWALVFVAPDSGACESVYTSRAFIVPLD